MGHVQAARCRFVDPTHEMRVVVKEVGKAQPGKSAGSRKLGRVRRKAVSLIQRHAEEVSRKAEADDLP